MALLPRSQLHRLHRQSRVRRDKPVPQTSILYRYLPWLPLLPCLRSFGRFNGCEESCVLNKLYTTIIQMKNVLIG